MGRIFAVGLKFSPRSLVLMTIKHTPGFKHIVIMVLCLQVGYNRDGTIIAADIIYYSNGGCTLDESSFVSEHEHGGSSVSHVATSLCSIQIK